MLNPLTHIGKISRNTFTPELMSIYTSVTRSLLNSCHVETDRSACMSLSSLKFLWWAP